MGLPKACGLKGLGQEIQPAYADGRGPGIEPGGGG